jgi:imidazolonepropionase-like amidohydrolase
MKLARITVFCIALLMVFSVQAWSQSSPAEAFENVIIHTADGNTIDSGTIVWRNGVITSMGENATIPFDAYVYDGGDSLHVYPGFIDGLALWGSPDNTGNRGRPKEPGNPSYKRAGIQPHLHPANEMKIGDTAPTDAAKHGFTTAALGLKGQMLPGQIDLFFVNGEETDDQLLEEGIGILAQFEEALGTAYPSTTMALMAQFRQLFYDAKAQQEQQEYYASVSSDYSAPKKEKVLEALYPVMQREQPFYFVADGKENIERLFWLQDELDFEVVLVSGKEAYKKADELNKHNIPVLATIDLPEKPEWMKEDYEETGEVTEEMEDFREKQEAAYREQVRNIKTLQEAGVRVGYASNGMKLEDIQKNMTALKEDGGLNNNQILKLITQSTADILNYGQRLGDLKEERNASFTVLYKPFLGEDSKSVYSIINGELTENERENYKNV